MLSYASRPSQQEQRADGRDVASFSDRVLAEHAREAEKSYRITSYPQEENQWQSTAAHIVLISRPNA